VAPVIFECVVNVSEGRDGRTLDLLAAASSPALLDLHRDPDHNRAVLTLAGPAAALEAAVRSLAAATLEHLDLRVHQGVHPRFGVLDVVPFVPVEPGRPGAGDLDGAVALRDGLARWLAEEFGLPSFLYGPLPGGRTRTLPDIRRRAFLPSPDEGGARPDFGPDRPHPRWGASAVGARNALVAYNVWVDSLEVARQVTPLVRRTEVRALSLAVGERVQISCNLVDPEHYGPARLYDEVTDLVTRAGGRVEGAELVGLVPEVVLHAVSPARWTELGLAADSTIESRLPAG
jgi:glutamate formiminotransferase / 5-formyltetrahydrofolate cyclo-ligase